MNATTPPTASVEDKKRAALRAQMRRIRKRDTKPEITVRKLVHAMGYRYRLYRRDLPGTPDLTFSSRRKIIFVHGCFWHQHACRLGNKQPRANRDYWLPKLARNQARDEAAERKLTGLGWCLLVLWECEIRDLPSLEKRIRQFLE